MKMRGAAAELRKGYYPKEGSVQRWAAMLRRYDPANWGATMLRPYTADRQKWL
jgi:hypothetical protein